MNLTAAEAFWLFLLVLPFLLGAFILFSKSDPAVEMIGRLQAWMRIRYDTLSPDRRFNKFLFRPLLWSLNPIARQTSKIQDPYLSAGIWVTCTGLGVFLGVLVLWALLSVAFAFALVALIVWVAWGVMTDSSGDEYDSAGSTDGDSVQESKTDVLGLDWSASNLHGDHRAFVQSMLEKDTSYLSSSDNLYWVARSLIEEDKSYLSGNIPLQLFVQALLERDPAYAHGELNDFARALIERNLAFAPDSLEPLARAWLEEELAYL